jgi:enoyl-CoA hydratase
MTTNFANITIATKYAIGWLTINRPAQLNALNAATLQEIIDGLSALRDDATVRVIVLTGAGDKAFVAGADIKAMSAMDVQGAAAFATLGHDCMRALETTPKPVIAMVNGFALGGGCELAMACDFMYASDNAVFGLPEVSLGLFPGFGGTQRLQRIIGRAKAMEMIYSGRKLSADDAHAWGLVNTVVPAAELRATVEKLAQKIARHSPHSIGIAKEVIVGGGDVGLSDGLALERQKFATCFESADCREGLSAFLEKRKPAFTGQ